MVKKAMVIKEKNGNTSCQDAIAKHVENVKVALNILLHGKKLPNGYQFVKCHMAFKVKMEDFRRMTCIVVRGYLPDARSY